MNNKTLEILLKLRDEASKRLNGFAGNVQKFQNTVKQFAREANNLGNQINRLGTSMTFVGAAMTGPLALAFKNSEKYSFAVGTQINRLKTVSDNFQLSIAQAMIPVINKFTNILGNLYQKFMSIPQSMRDSIVQGTLMTGVFLTLGGVFLKVVGNILKMTGTITGMLASISPVQVALLGVVAALVYMIANWEKLKDVAIPILNALETGAYMVAIGYYKMTKAITEANIKLAEMTSQSKEHNKVWEALTKFSPMAMTMEAYSKINQKNLEGLRVMSSAQDAAIDSLEKGMQRIAVTGSGALVSSIDTAKQKLNQFKNMLDTLGQGKFNMQPVVEKFDAMKTIVSQTASAMTQSMGDLFFDAITNKFNNLKDIAANFGRQILQILTSVFAKMLLMKTIGNIGLGGLGKMGQYFHTGGIIRRAHSGYLAQDEVPIIAQAGEGIISRRGMAGLGAQGLRRLNRGEGAGGGTNIQPTIVIKAWDATDIYRNRKTIEGLMVNALRTNGSLRGAMKQYG